MRTPPRRAKAHRIPRRVPAAQRLPQIRLPRPVLLASTALTACFALSLGAALAQPAPNARPEGGTVVGGQATIARQPNNTVVTQSSQRTAIEWRSFDIGRDQTVTFQQPAPSAIALNRVTSSNPTEIAGRIQANGQVVVVNGAGIMVHQGAVVEAQSFIASTADTTNAAFMAGGRLTFDRPGRPGARVENAGEITVREAGLAALVAPGVANSGRIRARLGTVVLGGAETHTIDFHGDGLVAFDVTGQVRTAPVGPDGRPVQALVTNSGTILADGGNVLITARAVDGLVQELVTVGGTVRADSVGDRTGSIQVTGVGGGIRVHGTVAADGVRAGERGGTVVVNGPGEVTLGSTARVTASGPAGGGTVAVGTTAARARAQGGGVPADSAWRVNVNAGAVVEANATDRGDGGRIGLLAVDRLDFAGHAAARGGPNGGNGGLVELSSGRGFSLTGTVDTTAPLGTIGTLLIDPLNLFVVETIPNKAADAVVTGGTVTAGSAPADGDAYITNTAVQTLLNTSAVRLEATQDLTVDATITSNKSNSLTLAAGRSVFVNKAISTEGDIFLIASDPTISGNVQIGRVQVNAAITTTKSTVLIRSFGNDVTNALQVKDASNNVLGGAGVFFGTGGSVTVTGNSGDRRITLVGDAISLPTADNALSAATIEIAPSTTSVSMSLGTTTGTGVTIGGLNSVKASDNDVLRIGAATLGGSGTAIVTTTAAGVALAGDLDARGSDLSIRSLGAVTRSSGTLSNVATLTGAAASGFALDGADHSVTTVGAIDAGTGALSLRLAGDAVLAGALTAGSGIAIAATGNMATPTLSTATGDIVLSAGATLGAGAATATAGAVSLTGSAVILNGDQTAASRISIAADSFTRGAFTLKTGNGGTVEIAPNTAGAQAATDLAGIVTGTTTLGTLRLGAVTRPGDTLPTTTATTLTLAGTAAGFATLDLRATGAVTQTDVLTLTGVTLTGSVGSIVLGTTKAATLPTLGALTAGAGGIDLTTGGTLDIVGPVVATALGDIKLATAGALTLKAGGRIDGDAVTLAATAGGIALGGGVTAGSTLTLTASGGGSVTGAGLVTAQTLTGTVGSLSLGGTNAAQVTTLGQLTAGGAIALTTVGPLNVTGVVNAGTAGNGPLTLATQAGALTLVAGGGLVTGDIATGGGAIALTGAGGVSLAGGVTARSGSGGIGTLSVTATTGNVAQTAGTLASAAGMSLSATAGSITLSGGTISSPSLTLNGATGVTQTLGSTITTNTLTATALSANASILLDQPNALFALGNLTAADDLAVRSVVPFTSVGALTAGAGSTGTVAELRITSVGAFNTGLGSLTAGGGTVAGNVTLATTDTGATPASMSLGTGSLGNITANRVGGQGGIISFDAQSALPGGGVITVNSLVEVIGGGGLMLTANTVNIGGLLFEGRLSAPGGTIAIRADQINYSTQVGLWGSAIFAPGGTVSLAPRLDSTAVSVGTGPVTGFVVDPATLLTAFDSNIDVTNGVLEIGRAAGANLTIASDTTAGILTGTGLNTGVTLRLLSGGTISAAPGATLTAGRLEATGGAILLDQLAAPHAVGTLGRMQATAGNVEFRSSGSLAVRGAVSATDNVVLTTGVGGELYVRSDGSVTAGSAAPGGARSIILTGDTVLLDGVASAPGGTVAIQPVTFGRAMTIGAFDAATLNLYQIDFNRIATDTLILGGTAASGARAGSITVNGLVNLTGRADRLRLLATGGVATDALPPVTGIVVNRLGSAAPEASNSVASLSLTGSGNAIGTLDSISTNSFTLTNARALTVVGTLSAVAGGVTINNTGALTLAGTLTSTGSIGLTSSGAMTLGGTLTASGNVAATGNAPGADALVVTGTVQAGTVPGTATASSFGGNLTLTTGGFNGGLRVADGGTVRARSGSIFIFPSTIVPVNGGVTLSANGTITTGAGSTVEAGVASPLSLQAGAAVTLGGALSGGSGVDIATAGGGITLSAGASLTTGASLISLVAPGAITLNGTVSAGSSRLDVDTPGVVGGSGSVTVGSLTGSAGSLAPSVRWTVPTLGNFETTSGALDLDVTGSLNVTGPVVSAGALTLDATNAINITTGSLSAPGQIVTLNAGTGITATGTVVAGTLTGASGSGAASFNASLTNAVGTLGNFTGTGFTLFNTGALNIAGTINAPNLVRIESGSVAMTGTSSISASGGLARLAATGGDLTLRNTLSGQQVFLSATGVLTVPSGATAEATTAAGLTATGGSFDIGGTLRSAGGLSLTTTGIGPGLVRSTGNLDSDGVGALLLVTAGSLDSTGTLDSAGDATLRGTVTTATVGGSVTATGAATVSAITSLTLAGDMTAGTVALSAGGTLGQTAGTIEAKGGDLVASAGNLSIAGTLRANTAAGSDILLTATGAGPNSLSGTLTAQQDISLKAATAGASITSSGTLAAGSSVLLDAPLGTVSQTAGTISGGLVELRAGGLISQSLGATVKGNGVGIVAQGASLALSGTLDADALATSDITLTATGVGGSAALDGPISAGRNLTVTASGAGGSITVAAQADVGGTARFDAAGNLSQTTGALTAGALDLKAGGALTQSAPAAMVVTAGNADIQAASFDLAGSLTATAATSNVTLGATGTGRLGGTLKVGQTLVAGAAAGLTLDGGVTAGGQAQFTSTAGAVTQNPDSVVTADGGLSVTGRSLSIAGTLDADAVTTSNVTLAATGGTASLTGTIRAGQDVVLTATGALFQDAGTVTAGRDIDGAAGTQFVVNGTLDAGRDLRLTAAGLGATSGIDVQGQALAGRDLAMTSQAGALLVLGIADATGNATLTTGTTTPVIDAPVAGRDITVSSAGTPASPGRVSAGGTLTFVSNGAVSTGAGVIEAGTLAGRVAGSAIMNGSNSVTTLGALSTGSTMWLKTVQPGNLTVTGPVSATSEIRLETAGPIVLNGPVAPPYTLDAQTITLLSGNISQIGGSIRTGTLGTGTLVVLADAAVSLPSPFNIINRVQVDSGNDVVIRTPTALTLVGTVTAVGKVDLIAGGGLTIPLGTLVQAGTDILLTATSVTTAGTLIAGRDISITATNGSILQTGGDMSWTGALTLAAPNGGITQSPGATLTGAPGALMTANALGAISFLTAGNVVDRLGASAAGGGFGLVTSGGLTVEGAVAGGGGGVLLQADGGALTLQGVAVSGAGAGTLLAGGGVTQGAGGALGFGGPLTIQAGGAVALNDDVSAVGGITITATGGVTQAAGQPMAANGALDITSGGTITLDGGVTATSATLGATGAVIQSTGGSLALGGGPLSISAGGGVALDGANGAGSATVTSGGTISQAAGGSLALGGALAIDAAGDLTLDGAVNASSATLRAGGAIGQLGGATLLLTGSLVADAGGTLTLGGTTTATSANLRSGGAALLAGTAPAGAPPGAPGALGGSLTLSGALEVNAGGDVALDGAIATTALTVNSGGSIGQPGGASLSMPGSLTLNAAGGVTLDGAVSSALANIGAGGAFGQRAGGSLALGGPLGIAANAGITLDGVNGATAATLSTGGALLQAATGRLTLSGPLSVSAAAATLDGLNTATSATIGIGGSLSQASGGALALSGPLALNAGGNVGLNGAVSASTVNVNAGGALAQAAGGSLVSGGAINLTAGSAMTLDGTVIGNPMRLVAGGDISQAATGNLATGTFSVQAGGSATFRGVFSSNSPNSVTGTAGTDFVLDGISTQLIVMRDVSAGRSIVVDADGDLWLQGTISAPSIIIQAGGQLLMGTLVLNTGGVPYVDLPPGTVPLTRLPEPIPGTPGAVLESGSGLLQAQVLIVQPLGSPNATLALRLPESGGLIQLGSLRAPETDVTFDLGTGGRILADLVIRNLTVLGINGSAELRGTVRGFAGQSAASVSGLGPQPNASYKINDCPVGSVNCVQLVVQVPTNTNPLGTLGTIVTQDDRDDADIFVPNVADRDF